MSDRSYDRIWAYMFAVVCGINVHIGAYGGAAFAAMVIIIKTADMICESLRRASDGPVMKPLDVQHAFPSKFDLGDGTRFIYTGMTLRDWFAGQALSGILTGGFADTIPHDDPEGGRQAAEFAYQYADAMLRVRQSPQESASE